MYPQRLTVPIAVDASGNATAFSDLVYGQVLAVYYVVDGTNPLATDADFTITGDVTGASIITITNIGTSSIEYLPRAATCDAAGAASLYASGGTAVTSPVTLANERIKIVVAQGGTSKVGTLHFVIG